MLVEFVSGRASAEGDELYYEVRGKGAAVVFVPGAGGDGDTFRQVAESLSEGYRAITYDRRGNARSTWNEPRDFSLEQQCRDVLAVMKAAGAEKAHVVGNSSGAVIALRLAIDYPGSVLSAIIHEPPMARLHPRAEHWQKFFSGVYRTAYTLGPGWAMLRFLLGSGIPAGALIKAAKHAASLPPLDREPRLDRRSGAEVLARHELLPITNYSPDLAKAKRSGVRILGAAGRESLAGGKWFAENGRILAQRLGTGFVEFPGHHGSFMDRSEAWAEALKAALGS